jgi:plasmid stabilization system protein ParE
VVWKVKWTEAALSDIERIVSYIAKDSPNYAAGLVREARDAARTLGRLAQRGRVVPEWHDASVRELFVGNYRLIYKVAGPDVFVLGVIHGARDLLAFWQQEMR